MILIIFLWFSLSFIGTKYSENIKDTAFTIDNTIALRGICAIEIMLGHLGIATKSIVLFPNRKAGILFVGIFFALSGYGLMHSVRNKENYLIHFLPRRIGKILFPAYMVFLIRIILQNIINQSELSLMKFVNIKNFFRATNWYVWELILMYFLFYISIRFYGELGNYHWMILCFSLFFIGIAYCSKFENPWYGSTLCFWVGIIYFLYKDKFKDIFVLNHPVIKMISCCLIMILFIGLFFVLGGLIGIVVARNVASVLFVIIVMMILHRFDLKNVVAIWLGKYSYEIFLFHPIFINIFRPQIENNVFYSWVVIGTTILASYLFKLCENGMKNMVKKITDRQ